MSDCDFGLIGLAVMGENLALNVESRGYRVAVDDMGAGYSSLQSLASIEPDFLKFDMSLVRGIDSGARIDCRVVCPRFRMLAGDVSRGRAAAE